MWAKMRMLFRCDSRDGTIAKLSSPDDKHERLPDGKMELVIDKKDALNFLEPGKKYAVEIFEVPEETIM